jgi:hypothetical protein
MKMDLKINNIGYENGYLTLELEGKSQIVYIKASVTELMKKDKEVTEKKV